MKISKEKDKIVWEKAKGGNSLAGKNNKDSLVVTVGLKYILLGENDMDMCQRFQDWHWKVTSPAKRMAYTKT